MSTVPADPLGDPWLVVEVDPALLLRVAGHVRHRLQVPRLGLQPLVDEQLGVLQQTHVEKTFSGISLTREF